MDEMSFGKRVTMRDIGEKAGVSISTVSLALRNDPRLPRKTIERVQKAADELGYAPDPWLSSLSSYRRADVLGGRNTTVAILSNWDTRDGWREVPTIVNYHSGARRMAYQLGYRIEEFWVKENGGEARTESILYNRGIKGVLLLPLPPDVLHTKFDLSRFSVVQVGQRISWPVLNTVIHNHYGAMQLSVYQLRTLGYKRIGLVIPEKVTRLHRYSWLAAFLAKQYDFTEEMARLPILRTDNLTEKVFFEWLEKNRCDVVIGASYKPYEYMLKAGMKVPEDIGFNCLCMEDANEKDVSGIFMKSEAAGGQAMNLLHMLMMSGQRGSGSDPITQVIEGEWYMRKTLREQGEAKPPVVTPGKRSTRRKKAAVRA